MPLPYAERLGQLPPDFLPGPSFEVAQRQAERATRVAAATTPDERFDLAERLLTEDLPELVGEISIPHALWLSGHNRPLKDLDRYALVPIVSTETKPTALKAGWNCVVPQGKRVVYEYNNRMCDTPYLDTQRGVAPAYGDIVGAIAGIGVVAGPERPRLQIAQLQSLLKPHQTAPDIKTAYKRILYGRYLWRPFMIAVCGLIAKEVGADLVVCSAENDPKLDLDGYDRVAENMQFTRDENYDLIWPLASSE